MSVSVSMPQLGESVTEGTVTRWLKKEGERVEADEPLLEVSTDKVDTEIPSPAAGVLREIAVGEDETVEVGAQLAVIEEAAASGGGAPAQGGPANAAPEPAPQQAPQAQAAEPDSSAGGTNRHGGGAGAARASGPAPVPAAPAPAAPAQAAPAGAPAGDGAAAPAAAPRRPAIVPSALRGTTQRMSRPRQVIAQRMVESLQTSAQLTTVVEADVTNIARLREQAKAAFQAREGVKLTFLPFFAQATVEALKMHPVLNSVINIEAQEVTYHAAEHLGIAVDTERGLVVPVIHSAGDLNIGGLARKIADLAARTRGGQVGPDELAGGTFTLTNTGSRGALFDTPIINQPQVGILGF